MMLSFHAFIVEAPFSLKGHHDVLAHVYKAKAEGKSWRQIGSEIGYSHDVLKREARNKNVIDDYNKSEHAKRIPVALNNARLEKNPLLKSEKHITRAYKARAEGTHDSDIARDIFKTTSRKSVKGVLDHPDNQKRDDYHPSNKTYISPEKKNSIISSIYKAHDAGEAKIYHGAAKEHGLEVKQVKEIFRRHRKQQRTQQNG